MEEIKTPNNMEELICTRHKRVDVFSLPMSKQLRVVAVMEDSIHHLRIDMVVNQPSLRICTINCDMQSIPDKICRQAYACFDKLIGQRVAPGFVGKFSKKALDGCTHLTNLFHDACYNLTMAQGIIGKKELTKLFPGITETHIFNIFLILRPELRNSCVRYAETSPFMEMIRNARLPEKVRKFVTIASR